jgi:hypothetical protein
MFDTAGSTVPPVKLSASCQGVSISGTCMSGPVDLTNAVHVGVTIAGNWLGADVANFSRSCQNVQIGPNSVNGSKGASRLRLDGLQELSVGTPLGAIGPGITQFNAPAATEVGLDLNRDNGQWGSLRFKTAGGERWRFAITNETEFGSSGGSNFQINRYDNAGGWLGPALAVDRASGDATLSGSIGLAPGKALKINGAQVVGARQTGTAANATDLASAIALVNDLKAKLVAHGLIA